MSERDSLGPIMNNLKDSCFQMDILSYNIVKQNKHSLVIAVGLRTKSKGR